VIDIGCYKLDLTEWVIKCTRGHVVGIDIAENALTEGRKRAGCGAIQMACADAAALPFVDNYFDAAVITEVLEHVPNELAVLAEAERVVRRGGRIIVSVPANAEGWDNNGDRQEKSKMGFELNAHVREFIPRRVLGRRTDYKGEYFFCKYALDGTELGHRCAVYTVVK
jgi:2-polyprenyl-3-methyl-5-hydroxy-6-metoxy-1,4-benzoquinol methylase